MNTSPSNGRSAMTPTADLGPGDALIVVDLQRDFLPGGALAVAHGDQVVPAINRYIRLFSAKSLPIVFSRDWHPSDHCSFVTQGGPWPPHCIADTPGAEFASGLTIPINARIVSKATLADCDAYSAFQGTGVEMHLRSLGVKRVFVGGLATDYCVRATAEAALAAGFDIVLLQDAMRAVDVHPGDGAAALEALRARGAATIQIGNLTQATGMPSPPEMNPGN